MIRHSGDLRLEFPDKANKDGYQLNRLEQKTDAGADETGDMIRAITDELQGKIWVRQDMQTYCLRRSNKNGPRWCNVLARITIDNDTQKVIRIEGRDDLETQVSYHKQWTTPRNTTTALVYRAGAGEEELKRKKVGEALRPIAGQALGSGDSVAAWLRGSLKGPLSLASSRVQAG